MAHLSLYRKYRSQQFGELSGQDHVTVTLQNALRRGRVAHAYLFCGPRGTGKTSTARLLAKALNCEAGPAGQPVPEPCDACDSCLQIRAGSSLDVLEFDAASHRGIDDVRALRERMLTAPTGGRYKVYVVDEVHMLTAEAFNALLKTLEEPPRHVVFVLATTESHKIPATILSRCQRFDFRRGSAAQLRDRLREVAAAEGIDAEEAALGLLAVHANGSWRDGLSLLEQTMAYTGGAVSADAVRTVLGLVEEDVLFALAGAVQAGQAGELFAQVDQAVAAGKDPRQLLHDLTEHFRSLLLCAAAGTGDRGPGPDDPRLREQAAAFGLPRLVTTLDTLATGEKELRWSQQPRLLLEVLLLRLASPPAAGRKETGKPAGPGTAKPTAGGAGTPGDRETGERPAAAGSSSPDRPGPAAPASPTPLRPAAPPPARSQPPRSRAEPVPPAPWDEPGPVAAVSSVSPLSVGDSRAGVEADDEQDLAALFPEPTASGAPAPPPPPPVPAAAPAATVQEPEAGRESPAGEELARIRQSWRLIREELKRRKKPSLQALLEHAVPQALEGDRLVLALPEGTLADLLAKQHAQHPEALAGVIRDLCQVNCRVVITADNGGAPAPAAAARPAAAAEPAPVPPAPAPAAAAPAPTVHARKGSPAGPPQRELVHEVVELFEGRIVDDPGDP